MDAAHTLRHVRELRARLPFLRALRPDNPNYKLWLGDIVELANTTWGVGSPQTMRVAAALRAEPPAADMPADAVPRYLDRLERLDLVLAGFEPDLGGDG